MTVDTSEPYSLIQTNFGFVIKAYKHDRCGQAIARCGEFEGCTSRLISTLLKSGDHFVDGGANIGYFTLLATENVGPSGAVTTFEPSPSVRRRLQENVGLIPNGRGNVTIYPFALSDECGTNRFYEGPSHHTGISSLRPISKCVNEYQVETRSWDDLSIDRPVHVVKLDIEGAEVKALRGMRDTLRRWRPAVITEVTDRFFRELGNEVGELFELMDELGYQGWNYSGNVLKPIRNFNDAPNGQYNALFTHEDRASLQRLLRRGYRIENRPFLTSIDSRPTPSVLFFSMHGESTLEIMELCQSAGIPFDVGPPNSRLVGTTMTKAEQRRLAKLGVGLPDDAAIKQRLRQNVYGAVIVTTDLQVKKFEEHVRRFNLHVPLIVRHGNNIFDAFKRLKVRHFLGPSRRGLAKMAHCNTFQTRKLLNWSGLPPAPRDPSKRSGFAAYIHHLQRVWPDAWSRVQAINQETAPLRIKVYGKGNPDGTTPDLPSMARTRATVHIKDKGISCFAILRSMAMGTPVVTDRLTCERTFLEDLDGIFIGDNTTEIARELRRLEEDDDYWLSRSCETLSAARRQFTSDRELAEGFLRFIHLAIAQN